LGGDPEMASAIAKKLRNTSRLRIVSRPRKTSWAKMINQTAAANAKLGV
jgi:hypothetical protein